MNPFQSFINSIAGGVNNAGQWIRQDLNPNNPQSDVSQIKQIADPYVQAAGVIPQGLHDWGSIVSNAAHSLSGGKVGTPITGQEQPTFTTQQNIDNIAQHPVQGGLDTAMMAPMALTSFMGGKEGNPEEDNIARGDEPAMGGLVDKSGNPLKPASVVYSRGQQVKVNPEAQASIDTQSNPSLPNIGEDAISQPPTSLPNIPQSIPTKMANKISSNIRGVTSRSPDELGATENNNVIQDTYKRYNAYNPATQDAAAKYIYNNIVNPGMAANPKVVPLDNVTNEVVSEMRKLNPGIDQAGAKSAAHNVIVDLYNQGKSTPNDIVPSQIATSDLLNTRTALNQTASVRNFFNTGVVPDSLNGQATIASRNALSNILQDQHPEISQAIKDYGNLKEGAPSMYKASQETSKVTLNPKTYLHALPNIAEAGLRGDSRVTVPGALALGGAGLVAAQNGLPQKLADTISGKASPNINAQEQGPIGGGRNNQSTEGTHSNNIIPQSINDIKPDQTGMYSVANPQSYKDPSGNQLVMSEDQYNSEKQQLLSQQAMAQTNNEYYASPQTSQALNQANASLSNLESRHATSQQLNQESAAATALTNQYNTIIKSLQDPSIKLGLQNNFGIKGFTLGELSKLTDSKYANLVAAINNLAGSKNSGGLDFNQGVNSTTLSSLVNSATKRMLNDYYTDFRNYAGLQSGSQTPTMPQPTGLPVAGGGGLPNISQNNNLVAPPPAAVLNGGTFSPSGQGFENGTP